ncbi:hypothetical protein AJ80_07895 [Polytolypa hystricis UAMH7299]|uniref:Zn(2)-C6 fungal-type domain-containing protein n=1 Tax=Polytolypa hystricis (strain UAMH7299) TaxID=1447883 RepID=A0A2B7XHC2_POLH7|nr:hypothetical protein AJ80_07895 [Polytolypa hystricis UAMH7299]
MMDAVLTTNHDSGVTENPMIPEHLTDNVSAPASADALAGPHSAGRSTTSPTMASSSATATATITATARPTAKRGKYNPRACLECQRRKVKCTGDQTDQCRPCSATGSKCIFDHDRRRKRKQRPPPIAREESTRLAQIHQNGASLPSSQDSIFSRNPHGSPQGGSPPTSTASAAAAASLVDLSSSSNNNNDIIARLARIEDALSRKEAWNSNEDMDVDRRSFVQSVSPSSPRAANASVSDNQATLFPPQQGHHSDQVLRGSTSSYNPIAVLDGLVGREDAGKDVARESLPHCPFINCNSFPECCSSDLTAWLARTRAHDVDSMRSTLKRYFLYINPHYPCLNEHRFFDDFQNYISNKHAKSHRSLEAAQFFSLVNLLIALMKILEEYCTDQTMIPGWQEFSRANHLLSHITWLGRGDISTVQSLIIKSLYLLYVEEYNAAYDAIGHTVRLCFQNSLHRQSVWVGCTSFDIHMRQRIFWSIYCLDRTVAQVSGMPYMLRDSECRVDLPAAVDDLHVGHIEELPQETPDASAMPYQHAIVQWGKLSAEVWDVMCGIDATSSISEEFIVTMDARILLLKRNLPAHLQWTPDFVVTANDGRAPPYIVRQASILHLRINHLQLLLRRQELLSFDYSETLAKTCVAIAADSIDALSVTHFSPTHLELERYSAITYITGAIIPIACVILKNGVADAIRDVAVQAFERAMNIFRDIAPGLSLARTTMKHMGRVIATVEKTIQRRRSGELAPMALVTASNGSAKGGAPTADLTNNVDGVDGNYGNEFSFFYETNPAFFRDLIGEADIMTTHWE